MTGDGRTTRVRRLAGYFAEMLPLPRHAALATLLYVCIAVLARRSHGVSTAVLSWAGAAGAASLLALMVILRLMDELKDEDIDRKLFPDRPLPSGRVRREDLRAALRAVAGFFLVVNLPLGWAFGVAAFVLGYAFLMFRRFFAPAALRRSLWLTLATHNPIVPMMIVYGFAVFAAEHGLSPGRLRWETVVPCIVALWSPFLAWELARKIRSEDAEDDYVTYSKLLGAPVAVLATWAIQAAGIACGLWVGRDLHLPWAGAVPIGVAFAANVAAGLRFLRRPGPATSDLRRFATLFVVVTLASPIVGVMVAR